MEIFVLIAPVAGHWLVKFSLNHVPPYGGLVELMCYGASRRAAKKGCESLYVAVQQLKRVEHCMSIFS